MNDQGKRTPRNWSRLWRWGRWGLLLVVVAVGYYQWRMSPLSVETVLPSRQLLIAEVMGTGTLEARVSSTISPKISGRIAQVMVDQGEAVRAGQVLVALDDDELQQQVEIAKADAEAARAALARLTADKTRAVAMFEQAERHHSRVKSLQEENAVSQDDLDRAVESLAVATADMNRSEAAILEGEKRQLAAEKTLEFQRARLSDTKIKAPFDGLIVERQREAGDIAVPGSGVLTLISTDVLWIRAWVDETEMAKLAVDQPARIVFRSEPAISYPGYVLRLGKQADRETREFVVDVQVSELPTNWAVGQRAEVFIETQRRESALTLPAEVIQLRDGQPGVWMAQAGKLQWRNITSGVQGREMVEVVDGLDETEAVVWPPARSPGFREGRQVVVP